MLYAYQKRFSTEALYIWYANIDRMELSNMPGTRGSSTQRSQPDAVTLVFELGEPGTGADAATQLPGSPPSKNGDRAEIGEITEDSSKPPAQRNAESTEGAPLKRRQLAASVADALAEHEKVLDLPSKPKIMVLIEQDESRNYKGVDFYGKVREEVRAAAERLGKAGELNEVSITEALIDLKLQDVPKREETRYDFEDIINYKGPTTVLTYLKKQISSKSKEDPDLIKEYISSDAFWYLWQNLVAVIYAMEKATALETGKTLVETLDLPGTTIVDDLRAELDAPKKAPPPVPVEEIQDQAQQPLKTPVPTAGNKDATEGMFR